MNNSVLDAVAVAMVLVVLAHGSWWLLLCLIALRRPGAADESVKQPDFRLAVVVPAHDEEAGLAATLQSLLAQQRQPPAQIIVVSDNCTDGTAQVARAHGVEVLERHDPGRRGKGYALSHAIAAIDKSSDRPDGVVFIDADCTLSPGSLEQIGRALSRPGAVAAQAYYQPEPGRSELGRLRRIAFGLLHYARPCGARRIGLPTTAKGTGMAMRWDLAKAIYAEPSAEIAEDASTTLACARLGATFTFVPGATVTGQMGQTYGEARTQDLRWERGRLSLMGEALATAAMALLRGRIRPAAAALEVASLPFSMLALTTGGLVVVALAGIGSLALAVLAFAMLVAYVLTGSMAARVPVRDLRALAAAPRFGTYKLWVYAQALRTRRPEWVRSRRSH